MDALTDLPLTDLPRTDPRSRRPTGLRRRPAHPARPALLSAALLLLLVVVAAGCSGGSSGSAKSAAPAADSVAVGAIPPGVTRIDSAVPTTQTRPTTTLAVFSVAHVTTPDGFVPLERPADGYTIALPATWVVVGAPSELDTLLQLPGAKKAPKLLEGFRSLLSVRNAVVAVDKDALGDRVGPLLTIASQPAAATDPAQLDAQLRDRASFEGGASPELVALDLAGVAGRRLTYKQDTPDGMRWTQQYVLVTEEHLVSMSFSTDDLPRDASVFEQIAASFSPA